jgi:hypothetical protein
MKNEARARMQMIKIYTQNQGTVYLELMVKMWRDNRIRVGIWGRELGTRRKRWDGQMSTMMMM